MGVVYTVPLVYCVEPYKDILLFLCSFKLIFSIISSRMSSTDSNSYIECSSIIVFCGTHTTTRGLVEGIYKAIRSVVFTRDEGMYPLGLTSSTQNTWKYDMATLNIV